MDEKEMMERLHAVEVAQATGAAALAGNMATQTATQAGTMSTGAAMAAGNMATMVAGGIALIAGVFIGLNVRTAR